MDGLTIQVTDVVIDIQFMLWGLYWLYSSKPNLTVKKVLVPLFMIIVVGKPNTARHEWKVNTLSTNLWVQRKELFPIAKSLLLSSWWGRHLNICCHSDSSNRILFLISSWTFLIPNTFIISFDEMLRYTKNFTLALTCKFWESIRYPYCLLECPNSQAVL